MTFCFSKQIKHLQASAIRELLKYNSDPSMISFSAGNPATEAIPIKKMAEITQDIFLHHPVEALQYGLTEGLESLREQIKISLLEKLQLTTQQDELIILSGAQQGIDLTCKVLCNPGDTVICEEPSFIGAMNSFKSHGITIAGVPLEDDGMNVSILERTLIENPNTKFIYLIPNFQNPTGLTTSLKKRKDILQLAKQYNVLILEDDPYGALRFEGESIMSMKAMDDEGRVVYCGSFSKILSPGLRVGYLLANSELIAKVVVCKQVTDVHTATLNQLICQKFMQQNLLLNHLEYLRSIYRDRCTFMISMFQKHLPKTIMYTKPQGGLFIWCTLPDTVEMLAFFQKALVYGVTVVPGNTFFINPLKPVQSFRMNFATPSYEDIEQGIITLGKMCRKEFNF